jgi:hypothetical protein
VFDFDAKEMAAYHWHMNDAHIGHSILAA